MIELAARVVISLIMGIGRIFDAIGDAVDRRIDWESDPSPRRPLVRLLHVMVMAGWAFDPTWHFRGGPFRWLADRCPAYSSRG